MTGDALYRGNIYCGLPNSDKDDFKKSLCKIKETDFNLVLPGHNKTLDRDAALEAVKKWEEVLA